jgi:hypothetical protein
MQWLLELSLINLLDVAVVVGKSLLRSGRLARRVLEPLELRRVRGLPGMLFAPLLFHKKVAARNQPGGELKKCYECEPRGKGACPKASAGTSIFLRQNFRPLPLYSRFSVGITWQTYFVVHLMSFSDLNWNPTSSPPETIYILWC